MLSVILSVTLHGSVDISRDAAVSLCFLSFFSFPGWLYLL